MTRHCRPQGCLRSDVKKDILAFPPSCFPAVAAPLPVTARLVACRLSQIPSYPLQQNEGQEDLPSLHVWALEDPFVPASHSQRLAGMYFRASVVMHRGSHFVPQNRDMMPHFIRFLEEFR